MNEKAKGPGYEALWLHEDEILMELLGDFQRGKPLHWPVLPKQLVHRVWAGFAQDGYVRDERALDNIFSSMRDNLMRLQIANIVSGHDTRSPADLLDDLLESQRHEQFCDWLVDSNDGWRISDYGIGPLADALALAFEARTAGLRLKYLDRALHVTHMRGDLSKLFVEGGRSTVLDVELPPEELETT